MSASNQLYSNDVYGLEEALRLFEMALSAEAMSMKNICEPGDDFPARLATEAAQVRQLQAEYAATVKVVEQELVQRWLNSGDEIAKQVAEAALADDWSMLAI